MAKFKTDYVNLIATNLRDRYKSGFPILKELVQNADDAGATSLDFGYHEGLADRAEHELLQGPALWVLNDGRFKAKDQEAIQSFGLNSKAAESAAIGKFGLGMKSVFHLCEAFFYVANDGSQSFHEILSPWFRDGGSHEKHESWEKVSARDTQALDAVAQAQPMVQPGHSWFMLWIPLRRRSHVPSMDGSLTAPIIDRYPGDDAGRDLDFFTEPGIDKRIGNVLPLLRHLQRIQFTGTALLPAFDLELELAEGGRRLDHVSDKLVASGSILDGGSRSGRLHFMAVQAVCTGQQPFAALQASAGWPKSNAIIAPGIRGPVPDKGQPEGAVMVAHADGRRGHLSIQWAVFLPTEEVRFRYEARIPESSRDISITLHGQFFVDSGRRGIEGMDRLTETILDTAINSSESAVQTAWNQALAQDVVLPMVLPTVARYVQAAGFNDEQIAALTDALKNCTATGDSGARISFASTFSSYLHREYVWVRVLRRTGAAWELQPARSARLLLLPRPVDSERERPWRVIPGLGLIENAIFVDASAPRISQPIAPWDEESVCLALEGLPAASLCNETALKYLLEFLGLHQAVALNTERVRSHLIVRIRQALCECPLADLRAQRQLFRQLIVLLPNDLWQGIGTRTTDAKGALPEHVYKQLSTVETRALMVPADLAPEGDSGRPSVTDIEAWLSCIGKLAARRIDVARCLEVAEDLIAMAGSDRESQSALLRRQPRLPVLRTIEVRSGDELACSLEELLDAHAAHQLFRVTEARNQLGLTRELARAAPGLRLLVVGARAAAYVQSALLSGSEELPPSNRAEAMFQCISRQAVPPELSAPEFRQHLLNHVASVEDLTNDSVRRGVRYLLHGTASQFESRAPLWKDPSGQNSAWVRLWRMVVDDTWNVLPNELSDPISDKSSKALDIRNVDQATVAGRLRLETNFDGVDPSLFTQTERDTILGQLDDEMTWRRLPLHRDTEGRYGPVNEVCWLGTEPQLPPGVGTMLRFIPESGEEAHRRRQWRFINRWTAGAAATEVLKAGEARHHWRYLMDLLPVLVSHGDLPSSWHEVAWLPLKKGGAISPSSLLRLDALAADISSLAVKCDYAFAGLAELSDDVRAHPAFELLQERVPTGVQALPMLSQLMANAGLSVGRCAGDLAADIERHLMPLSSLQCLPAWTLMARAACATSVHDVEVHVLGTVAAPLTLELAGHVLAELADHPAGPHARASFLSYLKEWTSSADAEELRRHLPSLRLPAADGSWRPASRLAHGAFGVIASDLVDPDVGKVLGGIIVSNMQTLEPMQDEMVQGDQGGATDLAGLLERWGELLTQSSVKPAIGALIGLFGDRARELAERWVAPISFDDYLLKLNWKDPGYEAHRKAWMGGYKSAVQPFSLLKPVFIEVQGSAVRGQSLTGEALHLSLADGTSLSTLLAGPVRWLGGYNVEIRMRPIDCIGAFDHARQMSILQETAEGLLVSLYNQQHANLTELWSLFDDADQVELDVARTLILDGLPQMMRQLPGVKRHDLVGAALTAVDKSRRDAASARRANTNQEAARERLHEALRELERLVETDDSVQQTILDAIRCKVEHYQYEPSSVPFELLQNADDAVVEYQAMRRAEGREPFPDSDIGRFVAASTPDRIVLIHWGRPINYTGKNDGLRADFAQDLERMLMLGASAKELGEGVTGRFGLGFKSVLLVTDSPVVESGDLRFDIVAGCLPRRAQISHEARSIASRHQRCTLRPTIVELPLADDASLLLNRFNALAGLCTVFARQMRRITTDTQEHVWHPVRLLEAPGAWCELGRAQVPFKDATIPTRLLALRCEQGAAVVRLEGSAVPFHHDATHAAPAIWIHAPTRGTAATGLILNADFNVDTGRGSLPHGAAAQRNLMLARRLADRLAPMLAELIMQSRSDWTTWSDRLVAAPEIQAAAYWHAFWATTLVAEPDGDASQDVRIAAVHAARLFDQVTQRTGSVPNGLPGDLCEFAELADLRLAIRCDRLQQVLPILLQWPAFLEMYPTRAWCSLDVRTWLPPGADPDEEAVIEELDRGVVLRALGTERRLRPEDLETIASLIQAWPQGPTEVQGWTNEFRSVQLRSRTGTWKPVHSLHVPSAGSNDPVPCFVPDDVQLDSAYDNYSRAWAFIRSYLTPRSFTADELARWCLGADSPASQAAVIDWLSKNLDAFFVWGQIRARVREHNWIFELRAEHPLLADLSEEDRAVVLVRLGLGTAGEVEEADSASVDIGALDLETIHDWWMAHRHQYLPGVDKALWPQRVQKNGLADEVTNRDAWMTLFSLGIFKGFGRVRDEQNRAFLDFLHSRGWWHTISQVHPDLGAEQWMGILREYAETNQVSGEFEQWMDSFPRLYRVARWCDEYVELFLGLERRSQQDARHLLTPAADASLSGSGFDAPTLHRTLRIGHNLVIRELLRAGVLHSEVAQSKAFMPGSSVLEFLAELGHPDLCTSEDIHQVLLEELGSPERASFGGDYDIPLVLLAQNPALQHAVLEWAEEDDGDTIWDDEEAA
ncbi:sacsin N-terminal ATP-binding-like domain-containing protein [Massilia sp. DD77]|uniref:sacsin N-terminal ATP-binding-like domain-containing protein n=1 Tax=Massilia sp. DD77 TaxID=3109349 RepID=UPI002FFF7A82